MLCLIFTKKKFIAGTVAKKAELLSNSDSKHLYLSSREAMNMLRLRLPQIIDAYYDSLKKSKIKVPEIIPVAAGVVKESFIEESKDVWWKNISEVLKESDVELNLFHIDTLEEAFVNGLNDAEGGNPSTAPYVVVNALDDYIILSFNQLNGKFSKLGSQEVMAFKELSFDQGYQHILNELISDFNNAGLILNESDKANLYHQIESFSSSVPFTVFKNGAKVTISAEVKMSSNEFNELLTKNRTQLSPFLNKEKVESLGISQILLLGALADNHVMKDYLQRELSLGEKVVPTETIIKENPFFVIIRGLQSKGIESIRKIEEELRKKREEEERRRRKALQAQTAKDTLMNEIRQICIDPNKQEEYLDVYVEKGKQLGLPKEVITWNIQEALKIASLNPQPALKDTPFFDTSIATIPSSAQKGIVKSRYTGSQQEDTLRLIGDLYQIKGVLPDNEFQTKKAYSIREKEMKVLRVISTEDAQKPEVHERFMKLYNKELKYYGELSDISTARDGKFYSRAFYERNTLKDYTKKIGLYNKRRFEDLTSSDLKFMFQVLKEVNDLQVSHSDMNEDNIIIIPQKKWGFTRELDLKFVGFSSKDATPEEMENQVHNMWGRLIGQKVYSEFRQKFNI